MILKQPSEFEKSVQKLKSTFLEFQSALNHIKSSPLSLPADIPLINLWLHDKSIKALINAFCVPIDNEDNPTLKIEDLEEYSPKLKNYQIEQVNHDVKNKKFKKQTHKKQSSSSSSKQNFLSDDSSISSDDEDENGNENEDTTKKEYKRGPYKNYTIEQKEQAVRMLIEDHCSVIEISRKLRIPCKNIKRWSQQGVERKKGGGRKRFSPETEKAVSSYLKSLYEKGAQVSYEEVQEIARSLSDEATFKASRGWVVKFVDRQQLRGYYKFV